MVTVTVYPRANLARGREPKIVMVLEDRTPLSRLAEKLAIDPCEVMGYAVNGVLREQTEFAADGDSIEILPSISGG